MIPTHALDAIDRSLQDITGNNECFGGKVMLLGGDFRQVLPVVPCATETVVIDTCLKKSILWQHFQQMCVQTKKSKSFLMAVKLYNLRKLCNCVIA